MNPVLLSTTYLPPVSWMAVALQTENTIIELHETYPKQTFRNRCSISTASGILNLTVPVKRTNGNHTRTLEIKIDNSKNWQRLHWRSIITAYNKSPYFLFYRDLFEPIYLKKHELLIELNQELIVLLFKAMQIKNKELNYTDHFEPQPGYWDLRNSFDPGKHSLQEKYEFPRYMQTFEAIQGFLPDLSIIDLLFNLGPEALPYLKKIIFNFNEPLDIQS